MENGSIQNFTRTVFHDGNWNRTENFLAYVTLLLKTRLTIYRSPLYVKLDARYKRNTKAFHLPCDPFSAYIPRPFWHTTASNISWKTGKTVRVSSAMLRFWRFPRWKMEHTGNFSSLWHSPFRNAFNYVSLVAVRENEREIQAKNQSVPFSTWPVVRLYLATILTYNGDRYIVRRVLKWRVT